MKRLLSPLLIASSLLVQTGARAATLNPAQIPSEARWVAHLDVDALRTTAMGKLLMDQLNQGTPGNQLNAVKAMFGFDPRTDLRGITACGKSEDPRQAALIAHGTIDAERLVTLLKANGSYQSQELAPGQVMHSWVDDKKPGQARQYAAFAADRVVISQGPEVIRRVLAQWNGQGAGLVEGAVQLGGFEGAVFAASANLQGLAERDAKAAMLKKAVSAMVSLGEANGNLVGALQVVTEDEATAAQLNAMASGMLAFALLNQDADPNLKKLVQGLSATQDGRSVRMQLKLPVGELLEKLEQEIKKQAARTNA